MKTNKKLLQSVLAVGGSVVLGFVIGLYAAYNFVLTKTEANIEQVVDQTISGIQAELSSDQVDALKNNIKNELLKAKTNITTN